MLLLVDRLRRRRRSRHAEASCPAKSRIIRPSRELCPASQLSAAEKSGKRKSTRISPAALHQLLRPVLSRNSALGCLLVSLFVLLWEIITTSACGGWWLVCFR